MSALLTAAAARALVDDLFPRLEKALAEVDRLTEALEPGKSSALVDGMWREAERLGHSPYSARHALSYLVEQVEHGRAEVDRLTAELAQCELLRGYAATELAKAKTERDEARRTLANADDAFDDLLGERDQRDAEIERLRELAAAIGAKPDQCPSCGPWGDREAENA